MYTLYSGLFNVIYVVFSHVASSGASNFLVMARLAGCLAEQWVGGCVEAMCGSWQLWQCFCSLFCSSVMNILCSSSQGYVECIGFVCH